MKSVNILLSEFILQIHLIICLFQEDKEAIQELLKQIALRVTNCIAASIKTASVADNHQSKLALDESEFMAEAENKINQCIEKIEDSEDCLNKVRQEIYNEMEHKENDIMETVS